MLVDDQPPAEAGGYNFFLDIYLMTAEAVFNLDEFRVGKISPAHL